MKDRQIAKLLHFGKRGSTLHYSHQGYRHCESQGYEDPESWVKPFHWWTDPPEKMSLHWHDVEIPAAGIPVVDVRDAVDTPAGHSWVFNGPLLDVDLPDGAVDRLPEVSSLLALGVAGNSFGTLLADHRRTKQTQDRGSLDTVSLSEYVAGWREHGARIGRFYVENGAGRIEWEQVPAAD
jgi:hypothetical protein